MPKSLFTLILSTLSLAVISAQQPKKPNTSDIYESIKKLNFLGSVMYVAAHPDDENTRLISYFSNEVKARTAYLAITRGDGGQNLIGPEISEELGVIRTQELLAARRVDGGEQRFTRANDFGFSKHPDETLKIWNKNDVLNDVVLYVRTFKPDVIINRFDHRTPGTTHGHHTSSAMLSVEAFDLASNRNIFPEQLKVVDTWQPKRVFFNTTWWFYGSPENFEKADKSNMLYFDTGVYYPQKGLSNNELAAIASSQHLSQGFGRTTTRGTEKEYIELIKGDFPADGQNPFYGIDTSWSRIKGGQAIGNILYDVEENFNFKDPSVHIPNLIEAYKLINQIEDIHWKEIKLKELKSIIEACAGLYLEVSANEPTLAPRSHVNVGVEVVNRSNSKINLKSVSISLIGSVENPNIKLENNIKHNYELSGTIPNDTKPSSPYWLNKKGTLGMYKVEDKSLIGLPESPRPLQVHFILDFDGYSIPFSKDVVYRYSKPDKGELYRPFEIIPEASAKISEKVIIFENDKQKNIQVLVKAGKDSLHGFVQIAHPNDWTVFPEKQEFEIVNKDQEKTLEFTIIPPKNQSEGLLTPMVHVEDNIYTRKLVEIDYEHIPFQTVLIPSESKVVRLNIQKRGENIAYVEGAGDVLPESLEQIGYHVAILKPEDINPETLSRFDAVVVGIRAYNTIDELKHKQSILFDFVEKGGNMIVQYNTNFRLNVDEIAPYDLKLSRDRVTEEDAEVRLLNPNHEVLNFPNKITEDDFDGWTQERGLYFPNEWSEEFSPILSMNDKGETPKDGSLLVAKYGKGYYIYTGLSFFREFPEGVSGAYRLFANMLSIGKENLKLEAKLND
ncbi:PIG-L family deacetylase [Yeosuana sp. MJ-SS3]|uniref:PIG-L family deacetylase n=1 Tax=Gilvirhabdus luticola TaxID=3079858 RepID=A0ABU3U9W7_9FLAO|nr:PIG-L family deacetylase [Yeosuana sp. MJ-SS3]MDU8887198.1 PIG-L family deacetylase [Yeosuana sp. MJ-SS3]